MRSVTLILVALPLLCWGQGNLVPNPSFEEYSQCPWTTSQHYFVTSWTNTGVLDCSPDYYNGCDPGHMSVPLNSTGFQYAHSGNGYMGFFAYTGPNEPNGREYVQVELVQPIVASVRYQVCFNISLADKFQYGVGPLGVLFTDTMLVRTTPFNNSVSFSPQIQSPIGVTFIDKTNWTLVCDTFSSRFGGERFISIGNFASDDSTNVVLVPTGENSRWQSYYYIDDVSVIALDTLTGIAEAQRLRFHVHPNPSSGSFEVRASVPWGSGGMLILHDAQGRAVLRQQLRAGQHSATVGTAGLAAGVYTLWLQLDNGSSGWEKVVVR